jgi:hypothetical protein
VFGGVARERGDPNSVRVCGGRQVEQQHSGATSLVYGSYTSHQLVYEARTQKLVPGAAVRGSYTRLVPQGVCTRLVYEPRIQAIIIICSLLLFWLLYIPYIASVQPATFRA